MRDDIVVRSARAVFAASLALAAAGCAGGAQAPQVPQAQAPQAQTQRTLAVSAAPAAAAREAQNAAVELPNFDSGVKSKTEKISPSGGKLTLPGLPSLKGSFGYTSNNAVSGATAALSASLTNAFGAPTPPSATIVYFLEATLKANQFFITFNSGSEKAKIAGSLLDPSKSYTLYVYVPSISNQPLDTISAGTPNAKHQLQFVSPFDGATLPTNTAAILELGQD